MSDLTVEASSAISQSTEGIETKKAALDEDKAIGGKKGKNILKRAGEKLAQPVVDQFHKEYGEDAKATPKTVADFVLDHAIQIGVAALTIAVTFAAARGRLSGFSKNFTQNLQTSGPLKAAKDAIKTVKVNNAKTLLDAEAVKNGAKSAEGLADALGNVADEVAENATGKSGILNSAKRIFAGNPKTEFAEGSKLPKIVDRIFGKNADKVKTGLLNAGIGEGSDAVDLALAAGASATAAGGTHALTEDAVNDNDGKLGFESALEKVEKGLNILDKVVG